MTFKNLHLLEYSDIDKIYEFCHIPVDSYILCVTKYKKLNSSWSKLNDYDDYFGTAYSYVSSISFTERQSRESIV